MTETKHDFECLIFICTCKKDEPMTTTKTYTYSYQVDPEIEMHLGSYLKQYEEIGFNKACDFLAQISEENFPTGQVLAQFLLTNKDEILK